MNFWWSKIENARLISEIYGQDFELSRLEVVGIGLSNEGPQAAITFSSLPLPGKIPAKWGPLSRGAMLTVDFFFINDLSVTGWTGCNVVDISINEEGRCISCHFSGDSLSFRFVCKTARLRKLTPY